jgi:hypothetical protein
VLWGGMNKAVAEKLIAFATEVAARYSNTNREKNFNGESFEVCEYLILSEHVAGVVFEKSTGKKAIAFFYYLPAKDSWNYFFPTDSHILGMIEFAKYKSQIEIGNMKFNFNNR